MPRSAPPLPFGCPACGAPQIADLLELARSGAMVCTSCHRRLRAGDVSLAIHRR